MPRFVAVLLLVVVACTPRDEETPVAEAPVSAVAIDEPDDVLAYVGETYVTERDLDYVIESTFDETTAAALGESARQELLESIVSTRAMAQLHERSLTPSERDAVDRAVRQFREDELARRFVAVQTNVPPPSEAQARTYYDQHPSEFGARQRYRIETLGTRVLATPEALSSAARVLGTGTPPAEWEAWAQTLSDGGLEVEYVAGSSDRLSLPPAILATLGTMEAGDVSGLISVGQQLFLVRLVDVEDVPPVPFERVRDDLIERLRPIQASEAMRQASDFALRRVEVRYVTEGSGESP